MTSAPEGAPPQRGFLRRDVFERVAGGATLIAAVLYGYGWLILAQFYGSFDVNPEDVGVTFAFVTVRVALVMAVLAMVAALVVLPLRALARVRLDGARLPQVDSFKFVQWLRANTALVARRNRDWSSLLTWRAIGKYLAVAFVGLWILSILMFVALAVTFGVLWLFGINSENLEENPNAANVAGLLLIATPIAIFFLSFGIYHLYERVRRGPISLRWFVRVLVNVLLAGVVTSLVAVIWLLPRAMAETVRGRDLSATVPFLPLIGLRADSVHVSTTDGGPISPRLPEGCVRLLGSSDGVTVLFDPGQQLLVRVPTARLLIEQPCR